MARADVAHGAADAALLDEREPLAVLVDQAAAPIKHQELEDAKPAGKLAREDGEIVGVVTAHRSDDDRSGAQSRPDLGDGGIRWIRARAKSVGWIEDRGRFLGGEAAEPAHQLGKCARRNDDDASGLIAPQFAQRQDQRIEVGDPLSGGRNQREEQALAVEFLEIEGLLGEDRGAAAWFADEVAETDSSEIVHE